ncbi:MAG: 3-phosphoshikimate 1-carboxyvinyltransferase [Alphaproteobacteria bacterium]|nr:3-phosphoshikimate 1-carboxyvinyltransferase [Alphaproteobacteria bacterium]
MTTSAMLTLRSEAASRLRGTITLPGDKSISHRALIFGALAMGRTHIRGLLEGADVMSTRAALEQLGTRITLDEQSGERIWIVDGLGLGGFTAPDAPLDLGNSGTGARLLMGVLAGSGISAVFTGDASLSSRPMARVTDPLVEMGAKVEARDGTYLPLTISAPDQPLALHYDSPVASAQVKSAILLAGLTARGETCVVEPKASRDHTEAMLRHFGVKVISEDREDGRHAARLTGEVMLTAQDIAVPADPSSAAFLAVAATITPDADITLIGVGTNPLRFGLFETLMEMGADLTLSNARVEGGENVADIQVRSSALTGITVPAERAASMIDEYPILSIAAAHAKGVTHMIGIEELRVKETDRIQLMADGLMAAGVSVDTTEDSMTVHGINGGKNGTIAGGVTIDACHDHRIAMSFLTLGLITDKPMTVTGAETITTSFPNFTELMVTIGARINEVTA